MSIFALSNSSYDRLKTGVQVILPATSSAYFALAQIWGWAGADKVVGTIAIFTTFLGVCLGISTKVYENSDEAFDGSLLVAYDEVNDRKTFSLEVSSDLDAIEDKSSLTFKVENS